MTIKGSGLLYVACAFQSTVHEIFGHDSWLDLPDPRLMPAGLGIAVDGNLVVESGTIVAGGGNDSPGIGGFTAAGNITITGGAVNSLGGPGAPAIGTGNNTSQSPCGNITITNNVGIVAHPGKGANYAIGLGYQGNCGTITIRGTVYYDGKNFQNGDESYLAGWPLVL